MDKEDSEAPHHSDLHFIVSSDYTMSHNEDANCWGLPPRPVGGLFLDSGVNLLGFADMYTQNTHRPTDGEDP